MPVRFWWPSSMAAQIVLIQNLLAKIAAYESKLPLTAAQVASIVSICNAFLAAVNSTDQSRQTMVAMTAWRDEILHGEPVGGTAPTAPEFAAASGGPFTYGLVKQLFAMRDLIIASPGYTEAIGEDLGLVGTEQQARPENDVTPLLKTETSNGYTVNISGSMQGMDAMRVEYAPKGGQFRTVAFLTNTPGGFSVSPTTPGTPESGHIRAVFIKKNEEFGNFSADYPVTLS